MALATLVGLDHVMILVRDLQRAAAGWQRFGFTISPMGTHSAQMGSANYTIMLGEDYIELLGIVRETPHNAAMRATLARREGIDCAAFTTADAAAGAAALKARGLAAQGPLDFGRPVDLPGGGRTEARFRTFMWPAAERPGGLGMFACQHLTRDAVWIPELQRHANTAKRIVQVEIVTPQPEAAARHMAGLIDEPVRQDADGAHRVPSGGGRADFVFLDRATLARRHPGIALDGAPAEGAAVLVIAVDDLAAARRAAGAPAGSGEIGVDIPPHAANGVIVSFVAA